MADNALQPILPPVDPPSPPKNQAWLIFYALICSNLFALFVTLVFEFFSLRNVVDVNLSRFVLGGAWASGVVIICAFAWGKGIRAKGRTIIGGAVLLGGMLYGLDRATPKPDPSGAPATLTGVEKLFQKYFRTEEAQPQPTPKAPPQDPKTSARLSLVRYQLEPYEIDKDFRVRVYVDNRGSDTLDVLAFGRSEVIDNAPIDYEPRKALEDRLRAKLIVPKKNLVWLSVPIMTPGSYSIGFDGSRLSSTDIDNLSKTASLYFMGKIQDGAGNTLLEPCFRTVPGKQELLLCTEHPVPPSKQHELKLIFKDSPLFTPQRRNAISDTVESFYGYLVGLGFEIPIRLPPLGVNETGSAQGGTFPGDPVYDYAIGIGKSSLELPLSIREAYATYWFGNILHAHDVVIGSSRGFDRGWMSEILADYYSRSSLNASPDDSYKGFNGWPVALWQIRKETGAQFLDRALFYAANSPEPEAVPYDTAMKEFNGYFYFRLLKGVTVIDNDWVRMRKINELLKARGLTN